MSGEAKKPTLDEFRKAERKAACSVCKLPPDIRVQIGRPATDKKIPIDQQLRWIKLVTGKDISVEELKAHNNGRHDA